MNKKIKTKVIKNKILNHIFPKRREYYLKRTGNRILLGISFNEARKELLEQGIQPWELSGWRL